jgi:hypothetical protein
MRIAQTANFALILFLLTAGSPAQQATAGKGPAVESSPANAATEDISGMYSFLKEGEFVQINLEPGAVSGYVSRQGDMDSDRGQFLDQFFNKASVRGHDVSFLTKPVHGVWFEFKGRFERGPAKARTEDAYYLLRGTLTEFRSDAANKTTSHSREVEFTWLAQPLQK